MAKIGYNLGSPSILWEHPAKEAFHVKRNRKEKKTPVRGVRVRTINLGMMLVSCALYVVLLLVTFHTARNYQAMVQATNLYILCQEEAALVSEGSDCLTNQARMFTVTRDSQCVENYFTEANVTRRRDLGLEKLHGQASTKAQGFLETALDYSNQLMGREIYAMRLIAQAEGWPDSRLPEEMRAVQLSDSHLALDRLKQMEEARELVFGAEYEAKKQLISSNIDFFLSDVLSSTQRGQQDSVEDLEEAMGLQRVLFSALFVMNLIVFAMITFLIVKPLQVYVNCVREEKLIEITGAYEFKYLALTYNDIYELNAANQVLQRHQAERDSLTGIMNQSAFEQVKEVLRVKEQPIALLLADMDRFQLINEGFGQEAGDQVLKKVARLLRESFRTTDFPARVEGDRFAVILTDLDSSQQSMIEGKVKAMNDALLNPMDDMPQASLSVGAAFSASGFSDELYRQAEEALRQVKENGRCGCRFYGEGQAEKKAGSADKISKESGN